MESSLNFTYLTHWVEIEISELILTHPGPITIRSIFDVYPPKHQEQEFVIQAFVLCKLRGILSCTQYVATVTVSTVDTK